MTIEWTEDLSVRISWIDAQHKEMFEKVNALVRAFDTGKGKEEIMHTLRFLSDYIVTHFKEEEYVMERSGYPYYLAHKSMHDEFIKNFAKLKDQAEQHGPSSYMVFEVKERLSWWIRNHINIVDRAMSDYLIKNNYNLK